jgi:hypothetical protein
MFCAPVLAAGVTLRRGTPSCGEGLRNVGYRLDDCAVTVDAVEAQDGGVIHGPPGPGSGGRTVRSFTRRVFGALIELGQE